MHEYSGTCHFDVVKIVKELSEVIVDEWFHVIGWTLSRYVIEFQDTLTVV